MSFGEAIKSVFFKYGTFSGRACRSEYWYFFLFNLIAAIGLSLLAVINPSLKILSPIYSLAVFIPGLAVAVRRLHDIGKSGWTMLIFMIQSIIFSIILSLYFFKASDGNDPSTLLTILLGIFGLITFALAIIFIVWMCKDSQHSDNQYGPNPKLPIVGYKF